MLFKVLRGDPQFIMAHSKGILKIMSLLRASGGVTYMDVAGVQVPMYNGVPLIRNDYLTADTSAGAGTQVDIYTGSFGSDGIVGLIPAGTTGISVGNPIEASDGDYITRHIKMYGSMAIHSVLSVAQLSKVTV